ncbi:MAG: hypothetical protein ACRDKL_01250 [Solirubrobacteraceae bacterium]
MGNRERKEQCERRMLALVEDFGLPVPDQIDLDHGEHEVLFMWSDRKVAVIVDLEEFEETDANGGYSREGLAA